MKRGEWGKKNDLLWFAFFSILFLSKMLRA
jgi:hypothetical protein